MKKIDKYIYSFVFLCFALVAGVKAQAPEWILHNNNGGDKAITSDASGNTYSTGSFQGTINFGSGITLTSANLFTTHVYIVKRSPTGTALWARQAGSVVFTNTIVTAITVSGSSVYITGRCEGATNFNTPTSAGTNEITAVSTYGDTFVAKFDDNGNFQWAKRAGALLTAILGRSIVASATEVYVAGTYFGTNSPNFNTPNSAGTNELPASIGSGEDMFLAKYDNNGNFQWARRAGRDGANESANAVAMLGTDIYVTGGFVGTINFNTPSSAGTNEITSGAVGQYDMYLAKYSNTGVFQWAKRAGPPVFSGGTNEGNGLVALGSAVYVAGTFSGTTNFNTPSSTGTNEITSAGSSDMFLARYDNNGNFQWARRAGGTGQELVSGLAISSAGTSLYVAGNFENTLNFNTPSSAGTNELVSGGERDVFYAKYDDVGTFQWAARAGGIGNDAPIVVTAANASMYVAGYYSTFPINFNTPSAEGFNELPSTGGSFFAKVIDCPAVRPAISTASLAHGSLGIPYSQTLAQTGITTPTWSIVSAGLPAGLTLNPTSGVISGTPTAVGSFSFAVLASDGTPCGKVGKSYTIKIDGIGSPNALDFDGVNDYVEGAPITALSNQQRITVEAWVKLNNYLDGATIYNVVSDEIVLGTSNSFFGGSDDLSFKVGSNSSLSFMTGYTTTNALALGTWYHVVGVFDGTQVANADRLKIYINGVQQTLTYSLEDWVNFPEVPPTQTGNLSTTKYRIGSSAGSGFLNGQIDELRVWNIARTPTEITNNKDKVANADECSLISYFNFDQGIANGTNSGLNTIPNLKSPANDAKLYNFALTGASSNWVAGQTLGAAGTVSASQPEIDLKGNGVSIANNDLTPSLADNTDFGAVSLGGNKVTTFTIENLGSMGLNLTGMPIVQLTGSPNFMVTTQPSANAITAINSLTFVVTFTPSSTGLKNATISIANDDCNEANYVFNIQGTGNIISGAISMNRTNGTNIDLGSPNTLKIQKDITIEAWVNPGSPALGSEAINTIIANKGNGIATAGFAFFINSYSFSSNDGRLHFESQGSSVYTMPNAVIPNVWQHIAVSVNGTTQVVSFYVNGVLQTNDLTNPNNGVNVTETALNLRIGAFGNGFFPFIGALDELRIWNRPLTQAEIVTNISNTLSGQDCNLQAYWKFDEASGTAANDVTIGASNGTLLGSCTRIVSGANITGILPPPMGPCTSTWNGTAWSDGKPTGNTVATFAGNYDTSIDGNIVITKEIIVNAGSTLAIGATGNVKVFTNLTSNGGITNCIGGTLTVLGTSTGTISTPALDPTVNSSGVFFTAVTNSSLTINWVNGNGAKRVVIIKPNSPVNGTALTDGITYTANTNFILGSAVDGTAKVVYNGDVGTSVNITGLSTGITYYVAIFEYNEGCALPNYRTTTFVSATPTPATFPTAPIALAGTNVTSPISFRANWQSTSGITDYILEISNFSNFSSILATIISSSQTGIQVSSLPNTSGIFYYRVRAVNVAGVSPYSNTMVIITKPIPKAKPPVALAAKEVTKESFKANWQLPPDGASYYYIDVALDVAFTQILPNFNNKKVTIIEIPVDKLNPYTTYYYRLRTVIDIDLIGIDISPNSNVISVTTLPTPPKAIEALNITANGFQARWEALQGITSFRLDVSSNKDFTILLVDNATVSGTSFTVTNLPIATAYFYRLRAVAAGLQSVNPVLTSENSNIIEVKPVPVAPVATAATNVKDNVFTANWREVVGADAYLLDVSEQANFATTLAGFKDLEVKGTSKEITGLKEGKIYYYRLRASNSSGNSLYSNSIEAITLPSVPQNLVLVSATLQQINVGWAASKSELPLTYLIDVASNSGFTNIIVKDRTSTLTNLSITAAFEAGKEYYVRVKARHSRNGESEYSETLVIKMIPAIPLSLLISKVTENSFNLAWASALGADSYEIEVATTANFTPILRSLTATATNIDVSGLNSLQQYFCRVRAVNKTGKSANSSSANTITLPNPTTTNKAKNVSSQQFTAAWNASTQANTYILEVAKNEGFTDILAGFSGLEISNVLERLVRWQGRESELYYRVRVVATVQGQRLVSRPSNIQKVRILQVPFGFRFTNVKQTSFDVDWNATDGAEEYEVSVSLDNFATILTDYRQVKVSSPSIKLEKLEGNRPYQIRVKALSSDGASDNGNASQLTLPLFPQEVYIRRLSTTRTTEIQWQYFSLPFSRLSNMRFVVERSDIDNAPFRPISSALTLADSRSLRYDDVTGTQRLQATYRLRISNEAGEVIFNIPKRIITAVDNGLIDENAVVLYPNPSSDVFRLQIQKIASKSARVRVFDNIGRLVKIWEEIKSVNESEFDISQLATGKYVVEISWEKQSMYLPLIKE